ncbi:hypothetical protein N0V90_006031 [Kalmusia sp. IMI 367209]|nr:hypothetical protein N0V90_006031 [Kalmusia sp. IMI 367209]
MEEPQRPLRLLSFDSGGLRALSSLMILHDQLEQIGMEEIRRGHRAPYDTDPLRPCDYFDLIGGSGCGAIVALLLGRLRLNTKDCVNVYLKIVDAVFKADQSINILGQKLPTASARYSVQVLQTTIQSILLDLGYNEDEPMWDYSLFEEIDNLEQSGDQSSDHEELEDINTNQELTSPVSSRGNSLEIVDDPSPSFEETNVARVRRQRTVQRRRDRRGCRVAVLATLVNGLPCLLSTYDPNDKGTRICEAIRASCMMPFFFEEIPFGTHRETYVSGGMEFANPAAELAYAAKTIWEARPIGIIVSIGCGLRSIPSVRDSWLNRWSIGWGSKLGPVFAAQGSSAARVENEMKRMYHGTTTTFVRYDLDRGLANITMDQWMKEDEAAALTEAYMRDSAQQRKLQKCAKVIVNLTLPISTLELPATFFKFNDTEKLKDNIKTRVVRIERRRLASSGSQTEEPQLGKPGLFMDDAGKRHLIYPVKSDSAHSTTQVYSCFHSDKICFRVMQTEITPGRYKVKFVLNFWQTKATPPDNVVLSAGRPRNPSTFMRRQIDVKITPDVGTILLAEDAVRFRLGEETYQTYMGLGWVEVELKEEVSVGVEGNLGLVINNKYTPGMKIGGWSFGGVRLVPVGPD